jgi:uncharacterized protein (DUF2147 family)
MKKVILSFILMITAQTIFAQKDADLIIGTWQTGSGNARVEIYKNANNYQGKIIWLSEPIDPATNKPKTDTKHPNNKLHTRPLMGLINLWGFSFNDNEGNWDNGHIYDPKTGKEYKCTIKAKDKNSLDVRGYIGISLIGRTDTWTRVKS